MAQSTTLNSYIVFVAEANSDIVIDCDVKCPDTLREAILEDELNDANYDKQPDGLWSVSVEANDEREALLYGLFEAFRDEVPSVGAIWTVLGHSDRKEN